MLGLPDGIRAGLFDLDGVLTRTATVHAAAWKEPFDDLLRRRAVERAEASVPFDVHADHGRYVDGRKRADGVRSFLSARGISVPEGAPDDPPTAATVHGLGNRKNKVVLAKMAGGIEVYPGSVRYVEALRDAGLGRAVVSSSTNTRAVLETTGLAHLFDVDVDGVVAEREGLAGKPSAMPQSRSGRPTGPRSQPRVRPPGRPTSGRRQPIRRVGRGGAGTTGRRLEAPQAHL